MYESYFVVDPRRLLELWLSAGWRVVAPVLRDGALVPDILKSAADLPRGITDDQSPGRYRLENGDPGHWFDSVVGAQGWKRWLHPPLRKLWTAQRCKDGWEVIPEQGLWPETIFFGVRSCDLSAIERQAEVFRRADDDRYAACLAETRIVAVNCGRCAETCFCASMGTGPQASAGFDLALTEVDGGLLVKVGTARGAGLLEGAELPKATEDQRSQAREHVSSAAASQVRKMPEGIAEGLREVLESPRWEDIATRCLQCTNCTAVCPTCFCVDIADRTDLGGETADRWQRWDSCFSPEFTYLHGGAVRHSSAARYRQWMTHKLSAWHEQFGASGCTGCGRCITWCPAGIDLVAEARALTEME